MFLTKEISYSYYPFGMRMNGLHYTDTKLPNKYLYNGKELQDNTGYYDYGFRQLDPALGPWFVQDALAEKYKSVSAYAYVKNNPINAVDIAGLVYMSTPIMASIGTKYAGTTDLLQLICWAFWVRELLWDHPVRPERIMTHLSQWAAAETVQVSPNATV